VGRETAGVAPDRCAVGRHPPDLVVGAPEIHHPVGPKDDIGLSLETAWVAAGGSIDGHSPDLIVGAPEIHHPVGCLRIERHSDVTLGADGMMYFRGTDDKVWRVSIDGTTVRSNPGGFVRFPAQAVFSVINGGPRGMGWMRPAD
jgi:hypothetical protein